MSVSATRAIVMAACGVLACGSTTKPLRGMVASDSVLASNVGAQILATGGNAVDAAIATAFALAVVYPQAGNLGGGGFLVARVGGASYALDFREVAPAAAELGATTGVRAVAVPGSVAGLWAAYERLGSQRKPWRELIAPAIALARDGFAVESGFAAALADPEYAARLRANAASAALYFASGAPLAVGATWKNLELASVLERIADRGADGFYAGATADAIVAEMARGAGLITRDDLRAYRIAWRSPLELDYRGHRITTMPPPSAGGVTLALICRIVEGFPQRELGWHSPAALHAMLESFRRAFLARRGDAELETLLSPRWAAAQRAGIRADRATPTSELAPGLVDAPAGIHTTHLSVVDSNGNAVSLTTTINWWFGSGVTVAGAGFVLNNELAQPNTIAPGKRMRSEMAPAIVSSASGRVELVVGAAGGETIATAVFQIISNVVDYGFDVATAVAAPRFHLQDIPDVVLFEPTALDEPLRRALEAMGYAFKQRDHLADAPSIGRSGARWLGGPEPRAPGGGAK